MNVKEAQRYVISIFYFRNFCMLAFVVFLPNENSGDERDFLLSQVDERKEKKGESN